MVKVSPNSASSNKSPQGTAPKIKARTAPKLHQNAPLIFLYKLSAAVIAVATENTNQTIPIIVLSSMNAKTAAPTTATNPAKPSG